MLAVATLARNVTGLHIDVIGRSVAWFLRRTSVLLNLYRSWSIVFLTLVPCFPVELAPRLMLNLGSSVRSSPTIRPVDYKVS
jgi:hypothetical protein